MRHVFLPFLLALTSMLALPAHAGAPSFSNLRFTANADGDPDIMARVTYVCADTPWGGESSVSRTGNVVTVTVPNSQDFVCIGVPPPPVDVDLSLGVLPPGDYQFVLQVAAPDSGSAPTVLLTGNFTVWATPPLSDLRIMPTPAPPDSPIVARLLYACANGTGTALPTVTRQGSRVTLRIPMALEPCFGGLPPPPRDVEFALGSFARGTYTLVVQQEVSAANVVIPALSAPIIVQGQVARAVPVDGRWGLVLLALVVMGFGLLRQVDRDNLFGCRS